MAGEQTESGSGGHDDQFKPRDGSQDRMTSQTARILLECNFRCPFCFAAWHEEKVKPSNEVMNTAGKDWRGYMTQMRERGFERITISGGEPTIHPEFLPLIRFAKSLGYRSVELQTNGSMLTADNVRRMRKAGVTDALVSLHSHKEKTFNRITVTEGVFETTLQGIRNLISAGINVMLSHVIIKWNVEDLVDYVRFCHREFPGMREILFFSMQPEARARKNMHIWPELAQVKDHFPKALDECVRLGVGYRIDSQEGYPMCFMPGHEHRVDLFDITDPHGTFGYDLSAFRVIERKKVKLPTCKECFFEPACYGFWEGYFMLYGHEGLDPVAHTDRLRELFPDIARAHEDVGARPDLVKVRKKHQHTWLEDEQLDAFPLPWKEGKAAAQEIK